MRGFVELEDLKLAQALSEVLRIMQSLLFHQLTTLCRDETSAPHGVGGGLVKMEPFLKGKVPYIEVS